MKLLAALAILCSGCASTVVYRDGQPILKTQANAALVVFRQGDTELRIERLDHAVATRAGGATVGTAATGVTGIITAAAVRGL